MSLRIFASRWQLSGGALLLLFVAACGHLASPQSCERTDKGCLAKQYDAHVARTPAFWQAARAQPVDTRIGAVPPELVDLLQLDVMLNDIPARPRRSKATPDFIADVRAAVAEIPPSIRSIMERRLVGIYFVDDFGGSAFADLVSWGRKSGAAFIILDPTQLSGRRANEGATWKESSPFKPDDDWRLEARIADEAGDNRRNAILYILLHELGHVLATRGDIHPRWDRPAREELKNSRFPFHALSWRWDDHRKAQVTLFDDAFAERSKVRYYFGANLPGDRMAQTYSWLESTNFTSLYAATNPGDDFAESFVTYVHTVMMRRPWEIALLHKERAVQTFRACWDEPRCAAKRKVLEDILAAELSMDASTAKSPTPIAKDK